MLPLAAALLGRPSRREELLLCNAELISCQLREEKVSADDWRRLTDELRECTQLRGEAEEALVARSPKPR